MRPRDLPVVASSKLGITSTATSPDLQPSILIVGWEQLKKPRISGSISHIHIHNTYIILTYVCTEGYTLCADENVLKLLCIRPVKLEFMSI